MKFEIKKNYFLLISIIVGVSLCIIDCVVGSQPGYIQFVARNCIGILIATLIIFNNGIKDYIKPIYLVWCVAYLLLTPFVIKWGLNNYPYKGQYISALVNGFIYGFIVIRIFLACVIEKRRPKNNYIFLLVWLIMMLLMVLSRNDSIWPVYFLVVFLSFYLTDFSKSRINDLCFGLPIGIVIGFFLIQGMALLFRPYDLFRYYGFYGNPNNNGLFYTMVHCAALCIMLNMIQKKAYRGFICLFTFLQTILISLSFYTGCRSAIISEVCAIICFLIILLAGKVIEGKKIIKVALVFAICMVISMPLSYLCIRYIPAIHLHPIFFEGEYSEYKVLPGEPRDSEKYISPQEIWEEVVSRYIAGIKRKSTNSTKGELDISQESNSNENVELVKKDGSQETDNRNLTESGNIRLAVYKWYISHLNFRGHRNDEETGVFISKDYTAPHAHNLFLQYGFWFGIPTIIMLMVLIVMCIVCFAKLIRENQLLNACILGSFIASFVIFGLFEVDWGIGNLSLSMFFIVLIYLFKDLKQKSVE